MELKQALRMAVAYISRIESLTGRGESPEAFKHDGGVAIEGVEYDEEADEWNVSVGFFRPWNRNEDGIVLPVPSAIMPQMRTIKTVVIDNQNGRVVDYRPYVVGA